MASCSSLPPPSSHSDRLLSQLLSKQRPFEFNRYDEPFSEQANPLEDDYVSSDFKTLAAKDETLREYIPIFEAVKRTRSFMKAFLKQEANKCRQIQDVDLSNSKDNRDTQVMVPVALVLSFQRAEMKRVETYSFIHKLWLRRIEIIRQESLEEYSGLQEFEVAIRDAQETVKGYRDLLYKEYFNVEELQQICPLYSECLEKALSKVLEEKQKAGFEMTEDDFARVHCTKGRLCSVLGLKLDFLDRLEEIPQEHFCHRTLSDWIYTFLQNNAEVVAPTKKSSLTKDLLYSIGFDPLSNVVEAIMARSPEAGSAHVEACEWAEIFITDEFKYNPLLSPMVVQFPLYDRLTNSWFQLPSITGEESQSTEDLCHVIIMNLATKESHATGEIQARLSEVVVQNEENVILFHGTDHQSAVDILDRGIDLSAGRQKRDFSCGSGFYLTKSLDDALDWAKTTTAKPAILIFQVDRGYLGEAHTLDLTNKEDRWREIVSSFRSGKGTAKTRKSLKSYDLIEGPVSTVRTSETSDELVLEIKASSHQMCLISDDFAEEFQKKLHSIVFLDIA